MSEPQKCRSCGAPVIWEQTLAGKAMPLDAEPSPEGNIVVGIAGARPLAGPPLEDARRAGTPMHKSHFATCPQAGKWRKR